MAQKTHSSDWDRLFNPNAPRRRGPIALFITVSLVICFLGVVMLGSGFGANKYGEYIEARALTATPLWKEYYAQQTATAQAQNVTPVAQAPAETRANVINGGNLRSEPRIAPETIVGQVLPGEVLRTACGIACAWLSRRAVCPPAPRAGSTRRCSSSRRRTIYRYRIRHATRVPFCIFRAARCDP